MYALTPVEIFYSMYMLLKTAFAM